MHHKNDKMASISENKMKEMEAEMDRFEEEISTVQEAQRIAGQSRFILGAQTFSHVQQQLQLPPPGTGGEVPMTGGGIMLHAPPPPPPSTTTGSYEQPQANYAMAPPPPPPGPSPDIHVQPMQQHPQQQHPQHPPPPPPSFVPHQLRHRHPRPPPMGMPPRPPMGMHPRGPPPMGMGMRPPPLGPPPGMPPRMMPPRPFPHQGYHHPPEPEIKNDAVIIAKPKIVYPVKKAKKRKAKKEKSQEPTVEIPPEYAPVAESVPEYEPPTMTMEEETGMSGMDLDELVEAEDEPGSLRKGKAKKKKVVRTAAGTTWEDDSLLEWETDDFRIFCGDLGNEVTDELLTRAFSKYGSFLKAKVCREKRTNKTKGYGFVSFKDPTDFVRAMREMNGKYVGNRPIKLRKSSWRDRNIDMVKKKDREKKRLGLR